MTAALRSFSIRHGPALAAYLALTLLMVWPLARVAGSGTAGWEGDNLFCIRQFWWVKHALFDLGRHPFFDPTSYYPGGYQIAHGELFAAHTLLFLPVTMVWGPLAAYNGTLLFSFAMTGFFTYLWVSRLSGSRAAGFVAGVVAAFLPYRFAHLPGHLHMVSTHWFPLALYCFERFLERKRLVWSGLFGLSAALIALSSWYYAYSAALMLPLYAAVRSRPWREHWRADWWRGVVVAAVIAAVLVLPFFVPYARLMFAGRMTRDIGEMRAWSLNFYDVLLPNRLHPLWGEAVARRFPHQAALWVEKAVSPGYTALALAAIALLWRRRVHAAGALLALWLASYLISLGPTLHAGDREVRLPLPPPAVAALAKVLEAAPSLAAARAELLAAQATAIPLPAFFMYALVPATAGMRVMARFAAWNGLATGALAGFGLILAGAWLGRRGVPPRAVRVGLAAAASGLILFESWSVIDIIRLGPRPVDEWLHDLPGEVVVVELPVEQALRPMQDWHKTVHQRNTIFGPIGEGFFPPERQERQDILATFPAPDAVESLRRWGVTHVLFTPWEIPDWSAYRSGVETLPALHYEATIGGVEVYRLHLIEQPIPEHEELANRRIVQLGQDAPTRGERRRAGAGPKRFVHHSTGLRVPSQAGAPPADSDRPRR